MNPRPRYEPDQARERILDAAEALFRRMGYSKTTVADIAGALSMSGANIYRFFPSKGAINDALCRRMLAELHDMAEEVVARPGKPSQRLEDLIVAVHLHNKARFTDQQTVHEMVAVAMQENWEAVDEHIEFMKSLFARLIAEGVEVAEFAPCEPAVLADLIGLRLLRRLPSGDDRRLRGGNLRGEGARPRPSPRARPAPPRRPM